MTDQLSLSPEIAKQVLERSGLKHPMVVACIPAYNEEPRIGAVLARTRKLVDEVIVCDDGSTDLTAAIAEAMGAHVIRQPSNLGYGAALVALFSKARSMNADYIVTLDGDGQHYPEEIPLLISELQRSGSDIVIGSRFLEGSDSNAPKWRQNGIRLISRVASNGSGLSDAQSGFRAYTRGALDSLVLTEDGMGLSTEVVVKALDLGLKIGEVPIHVLYPKGSSKRSPIFHGASVIVSTLKFLAINRPMIFLGIPGLFFSVLASLLWVLTVESYVSTRNITINLTIATLGTTFIGLMLLIAGIILWVVTSLIKTVTKKQ